MFYIDFWGVTEMFDNRRQWAQRFIWLRHRYPTAQLIAGFRNRYGSAGNFRFTV